MNKNPLLDRSVGYSFSDHEECMAALGKIKTSPAPISCRPVYARIGNPTVWQCEYELAKLHDAAWCVLLPSGMAAIDCVISVLQQGDDLRSKIFYGQLYPGTVSYANNVLNAMRGQTIELVARHEIEKIDLLIQQNPQFVFAESLSNPLLEALDIDFLKRNIQTYTEQISDKQGFRPTQLIVDNTLASPLRCKPLNVGVDMVVESIGKYIAGHNSLMAGAVFGNDKSIALALRKYQKRVGCIVAPDTASLVMEHLKTFSLRFNQQCDNAKKLALLLHTYNQSVSIDGSSKSIFSDIYYPLQCEQNWCVSSPNLGLSASITLCFDDDQGCIAAHWLQIFVESLAPEIVYSTSLGSTTSSVMNVGKFLMLKKQGKEYLRISLGVESFSTLSKTFMRALTKLNDHKKIGTSKDSQVSRAKEMQAMILESRHES